MKLVLYWLAALVFCFTFFVGVWWLVERTPALAAGAMVLLLGAVVFAVHDERKESPWL